MNVVIVFTIDAVTVPLSLFCCCILLLLLDSRTQTSTEIVRIRFLAAATLIQVDQVIIHSTIRVTSKNSTIFSGPYSNVGFFACWKVVVRQKINPRSHTAVISPIPSREWKRSKEERRICPRLKIKFSRTFILLPHFFPTDFYHRGPKSQSRPLAIMFMSFHISSNNFVFQYSRTWHMTAVHRTQICKFVIPHFLLEIMHT